MNKFSGKTLIVAKYEFLKAVKRKEFIIMIFVFPLFLAGITLLPTILAGMIPAEDQKIGYVDMTDSLNFPKSIPSEGFSAGPI
jgi:ABC-2 type transport system permease protein